ncbi:hypothetical protein M758_UG231400 [Ceratodon purpureus]|nr:hypothetical protein M758_UG231400 [Ceratodon purpureus]
MRTDLLTAWAEFFNRSHFLLDMPIKSISCVAMRVICAITIETIIYSTHH